MRIPKLPAEARFTLPEHKDTEDAPVYVFKPLNAADKAKAAHRLAKAEEKEGGSTGAYVDLAFERLVRVENLEVGEEPFDPAKHRHDVDFGWAFAWGVEVLNFSHLSDDALGKSSSPSGSA